MCISSPGTEEVVQVSRWLACMYRSLDEFQHDDSILGKLEALAALPLSTGELVSVAEKTVFFPVSSSEAKKQKGKGRQLRKAKWQIYFVRI